MYEQPRDDDKQNTDQRFTEVTGSFAYQKTKKSNQSNARDHTHAISGYGRIT